MNTVGLDYNVNLIRSASRHEQVVKENPDVVHARLDGKVMNSPGSFVDDSVYHDGGRTKIEKKRERKEAGLDLYSRPRLLLCCHLSVSLVVLRVTTRAAAAWFRARGSVKCADLDSTS
jgi:hypothetical protein